MVKHWGDIKDFARNNQDSNHMKDLLSHLEGDEGEVIFKNLLAMSICWHLLLDGLWKELAKANIPESVKALDDFANLCSCATDKLQVIPLDTCIDWLVDTKVNKWAPIDDSANQPRALPSSKSYLTFLSHSIFGPSKYSNL